MKIGLVLDDTLDKPDGVQSAVLDIGAELTRRGHEVHYLVARTDRQDIKNVHTVSSFLSIPFNGNSVRTPLPTRRKHVKELLAALDLDVIHVQMPYSPFMAVKIVAESSKNTKVYGTFHILPYNKLAEVGTRLLGIILKRNLRRFDGFFAVSSPARTFMKSSFGVDGKIIPNPVNYDFFNKKSRKKTSQKTSLVFVGRFDKRKGVRELLEAYARVPMDVRNTTTLTMCGKGPLLEDMKQMSLEKSLGVHFPGFVSDIEKATYLAQADIAVFPSTSGESFGIVLAEAMASKSGITIGGNNPGYSSVLQDFPEALFDPTDTPAFAKILTSFIEDIDKRESIGSRQHEYVKTFDIKRVVDTLLAEYTK